MTIEKEIVEIVGRVRPLLAGKPSGVQGAILADLLAIWLAGHNVPGSPQKTHALRDELLDEHIRQVRGLIEINARLIGTTP